MRFFKALRLGCPGSRLPRVTGEGPVSVLVCPGKKTAYRVCPCRPVRGQQWRSWLCVPVRQDYVLRTFYPRGLVSNSCVVCRLLWGEQYLLCTNSLKVLSIFGVLGEIPFSSAPKIRLRGAGPCANVSLSTGQLKKTSRVEVEVRGSFEWAKDWALGVRVCQSIPALAGDYLQ